MATRGTNTQQGQNDQEALRNLDKIERIIDRPRAKDADLCKEYAKLRPFLELVLPFIERIPVYGPKIAKAIRFLMEMADKCCSS